MLLSKVYIFPFLSSGLLQSMVIQILLDGAHKIFLGGLYKDNVFHLVQFFCTLCDKVVPCASSAFAKEAGRMNHQVQ
jgi:hypothetical protein